MQHPYWHPRYRLEFGPLVIALNAALQIGAFVSLLYVAGDFMGPWWPLLAFAAFVIGSVASVWICSEISILVCASQGEAGGRRNLLLLQIPGLASMASAMLLAKPMGSMASVADGSLLYFFGIGLVLFFSAPFLVWRHRQAKGDSADS